jgi:hypothetical protein
MIFANQKFVDKYTSVSFISSPNTTALRITAFKYTRKEKEGAYATSSEFVTRIFGSEALYYDRDHSEAIKKEKITNAETKEAQSRFQKMFFLSSKEESPPCYVTMLGQAFLVRNDEIDYKKNMIKSNAIGVSNMLVTGLKLNCYYRDMHKLSDYQDMKMIYYYCPVLDAKECLELEGKAKNNSVAVRLLMPVIALKSKQTLININFYAKSFWEGRSLEENPQLAVATIMPYRSSVPGKAAIQGAILFEWARYHLALGFKVVIYDRDGAHKQDLFKEYDRKYSGGSKSGKSHSRIILNWDNLIYHDFTILEMIDVTTNVVSFDNTEHADENRRILIIQPDKKTTIVEDLEFIKDDTRKKTTKGREVFHYSALPQQEKTHLTDLDKILTLSHCRMELDALYGIGNVLAIDSDEFLHCSANDKVRISMEIDFITHCHVLIY